LDENVHSSVIFEAIRREGLNERLRPFSALWWSGVAHGVAYFFAIRAGLRKESLRLPELRDLDQGFLDLLLNA
jgi:hypothetical protein